MYTVVQQTVLPPLYTRFAADDEHALLVGMRNLTYSVGAPILGGFRNILGMVTRRQGTQDLS